MKLLPVLNNERTCLEEEEEQEEEEQEEQEEDRNIGLSDRTLERFVSKKDDIRFWNESSKLDFILSLYCVCFFGCFFHIP